MTECPDRDITRGQAIDLAEQAMSHMDEVLDKAWQEGHAKQSAVHNKPHYTDALDRLTAMVEQIVEAVTDHSEGDQHHAATDSAPENSTGATHAEA